MIFRTFQRFQTQLCNCQKLKKKYLNKIYAHPTLIQVLSFLGGGSESEGISSESGFSTDNLETETEEDQTHTTDIMSDSTTTIKNEENDREQDIIPDNPDDEHNSDDPEKEVPIPITTKDKDILVIVPPLGMN